MSEEICDKVYPSKTDDEIVEFILNNIKTTQKKVTKEESFLGCQIDWTTENKVPSSDMIDCFKKQFVDKKYLCYQIYLGQGKDKIYCNSAYG